MAKKQYIIDSGVKLDELCTEMVNDLVQHNWLKVTIESEHRSLSQNALYWRWIRQIKEHINIHNNTDFTEEEIHLRMKHDFLGWTEEISVGSVKIPAQIISTRKISKGEMRHYMEAIDAYCADTLNLLLVKPEDSEYMKYAMEQKL